ncbi:Actin-binding protein IPP [Mizuhopecten yessoensis]|uniref:Actin-binding protein IPP n=1 Tax=Mizuhopecten yessoensis TaxID=6573 RepID=A0A210PNT0_MIZYE|nr:Actin-binding protein IPP [Mizuhopecten yessoensis]
MQLWKPCVIYVIIYPTLALEYSIHITPDHMVLNNVTHIGSESGTDGWEEIAPLSDKRSAPCMAAVNSHLYVIGGQKWTDRFSSYRHYCSNPVTLDSMECYDPRTDVWSKLPYMPMDRCRAAAVVL